MFDVVLLVSAFFWLPMTSNLIMQPFHHWRVRCCIQRRFTGTFLHTKASGVHWKPCISNFQERKIQADPGKLLSLLLDNGQVCFGLTHRRSLSYKSTLLLRSDTKDLSLQNVVHRRILMTRSSSRDDTKRDTVTRYKEGTCTCILCPLWLHRMWTLRMAND